MKKKEHPDADTTAELISAALRDERLKHFGVLNYLLNKHSYPLPRGLDYVKAFEEIEEYERYLAEMI